MKKIVILLLSCISCLTLSAQTDRNEEIMKAFIDSLRASVDSFWVNSERQENSENLIYRNMGLNPYFYKLFIPSTYYVAPIEQAFKVEWNPGDLKMRACDSLYQAMTDSVRPYEPSSNGELKRVDKFVNRILMNYYLQYPQRVMGNELYFADLKTIEDLSFDRKPRKEKVKDYMQVENPVETVKTEGDLQIVKPNFWKKNGRGKVQFTQHSISDNWYQGGESTNALYSELVLSANYDDKQKVQFENMMEIKLGFITAPSDTVHSYKTNSDLFRLYSKLGVKAFEKWYYTLTAEFKTQFFPNYKTNSNDLVSNFLSPMQLKLSLGMDYKLSKDKYNISVFCGPLTYKYVSLRDDDIVNPSAFEVEAGHSKANLYGSELNIDVTWKIRSNITWRSKFYYFTTYEKVLINWENTMDFKLNRYLTTSIFLHPRFDDGVTLSGDNKSYFQFKEMLTFGLSYEW